MKTFSHVISKPVQKRLCHKVTYVEGIDIIIVMGLKVALIIFSYLLINIFICKPYLPYLSDQNFYYRDMLKIANNYQMIFYDKSYYWALDTLYSRAIGLFGAIFWYLDPYIVTSFINMICSVILAIYATKIYIHLSKDIYISPRILFYAICLSPMINFYSLYILRDVAITCLFVVFIYHMLKNNWLWMGIIILIFIGLRPLMSFFLPIILLLRIGARWFFSLRLWWLWFALFFATIVFILYFVMPNFAMPIIIFLSTEFAIGDIVKGVGMGFMTVDTVSGKTGFLLRIAAADSMLLPFFVYFIFIPSFLRADNEMRIFISLIVIMHLSVAVAYLSLLHSFPGRKLLMFMPIFYIFIFCYFNNRKKEKVSLRYSRFRIKNGFGPMHQVLPRNQCHV